MKAKSTLRMFLLGSSSLLAVLFAAPSATAANWFWDGGTANIATNGDGVSAGTAGNWNTTLTNWDQGTGLAHVAWNSVHTANFGGTAGAVAVGTGITANGLTFTTVGYSFTTNAITLASGSTITSVGNGTQTFTGGLATADNILRFTNSNTTNNFGNATLFTAAVSISGASTSVQINGASTNSPVVLNGTLSYGGTTTVAANKAVGFSASTVTGLTNGNILMGAGSTVLRSGGSLNQAFLDKIGTTANTFTIVANNASTGNALNLTNFANASLAFWDNVGTGSFAFTGLITAGSNGYRFGSTRAGNTINITTTANVLSGTAGLQLITGSLGNLNITNANNFSGDTINNATGKTITIGSNTAIQNSAIDTAGVGTYVVSVTTPTIGGLIGTKNLLTNVIATTGYNTMTSLTLNPGTGATHTYSGVIANSTAGLALAKSGAGTQILSALNTFAGNVTVSGGTLAAAVSGTGGNSALGSVVSTRTINVNTGGTLRVDVGNVFNNNFASAATSVPALNIAGGTVTNGGTATNSALGDVTLAGGTLTATLGSGSGYGSWNLNGTVTSTGTSTISSSAGVPITLSAAAGTNTTFDVTSGTLTASAVLGEVTASGDERVSGFTKIGAGTLVLSGVNTYTGNAAINGGAVSIATTSALPGYITNGRYSVASGATLAVQNAVSEVDIAAMLGTTNFLSGSNLGFDTTAGDRTVLGNLADTAQGPLGIVKLGANTLTLSGTNTYTGPTTILAGALYLGGTGSLPNWNVDGGFSLASGASLIIPNTVSEVEVTTMLGSTNVASGASLLFDTSLGDRTYTSAITNSTQGLLNIGKIGTNTLTLAGTNTHTGNTTLTSGTLNITGSLTGLAASSNFAYGNTPGNTIVNISGSVNDYKNFTGANNVGNIAIMNQTGGSASTLGTNGQDTQWVAQNGGYGYLNITGGTFNTGRFDAVGTTGGGTAVVYVGGTGTFNNNSGDWLILPRKDGVGQLTVGPGGSLVRTAAVTAPLGITMDASNAHGALNIAGGNVDTGVRAIQFGFGSAAFTNTRGFVNLAGGTLSVGSAIVQSNTNAGGQYFEHFNFGGGTLKSNAAMTWLPAASAVGHTITATLYGAVTNNNNANAAFNAQIGTSSNFTGGLTIDTNNFATTIAYPLSAAGGVGVTQADIGDVSLLSGNSGYIGAPAVVFSPPAAPGGVPASGYAVIDAGKVNGIVITNPGTYAASETPTITLSGGGGSIAPFPTSALATANTSGGLIKTGAGVLTLSGANTYTGATSVNAGTLNLTGSLSGGGAITFSSGANLDQSSTGVISGASTLTLSGTGTSTLAGTNTYTGATSVNTGTLNLTGSLTSDVTIATNANLGGEGSTTGSLTFSGTSDLAFNPSTGGTLTAASVGATGATVTVAPTVPVTGTGIVILSAAGGITGTAGGAGSNFIYTGRGSLYFNVGNTQLLIDTAPATLTWRGNDVTNPTFWDLNTTTNWESVGPVAEKFFTGDALTFDDTAASFTVDISAANVFPGNITFNNTANAYTVQGNFGIFGGATLTQSGTGTTVLNSSNGYTGITTVAAGVLNVRNANALGSITAGTSVTSGAALEIQGGITTAAEPLTLNGTGISSNGALRNISGNNTWGTAVALASASSIGIDADTLIIPSVTGAFGLTKVGAGTLNIIGASAATPVTVETGMLYMGAQTGASTTTTLGAASAVTLNGSSNLTIRRTNTGAVDPMGAIGGTGSLSLIGDNASTISSGDYTMNNASTFSGGTTITGARAAITTSGAALGTGTITTGANGQAFVITTGLTVANNFILGSGLGWNEAAGYLGAIRLNTSILTGDISLTSNARITGAGTNTLSGVIGGSFGMDFFEDTVIGTISLTGINTYTGTTIVNSMGSGTTFPNLIVGNNSALGTTAGGTIVYGTGTTGTGSALTLATGITVTDETLTLDPTASGYRATMQTSGIATWDGNLVIAGTGGLLQLYSNTGGNLTIGSSDSDTVTGNNSLTMRGVGIGTMNSALNLGAGGLLKTDGGTWTITSNNNDFTGIPLIAGGILSVGSIADSGVNSALGAGTSITLGQNSAAAGTLQFTGASGGSSNRALLVNNGVTGGAGVIENTVSGQSLTLSGNITTTTPASASTLTLAGAGNGALSGSIAGAPALRLNKTGAGSWTVSGTNTYTGNTTVTGGTLNITGSLTGNTTSSVMALGTAATNTVVNVSNDMTLYAITGANIAGSNTSYNQTAGNVNVYQGGVGSSSSFVANVGYGYFNLTGGTFKSNGSFNIGTNNVASNAVAYVGGTGVLDWSGSGSQTVGYASAASLTVGPGGSVSRGSAANTTWLATNSGSSAIINIAGGSLNLGTAGTLRVNNTASGGTSVTLNAAGGTLTMGLPLAINGSSSGNLYANYAGGTLKASANLASSPMNVLTSVSTVFGPIDNVGTAQDFTGGITIDTDGFSMPYVNALLGATGNGVKQADIAITGGSGYIGAPLVQFTGGTLAANGAPASGYAVVSGGAVTEIVITSPGTYTVDPTVTLTGGGGTGASVALSALTANAADSGLTKNGAGTLTLSGANTYTGPTLVSNGVLALVGGSQTSAITLNTGASLGFTIGSPTITSTSSVTFNAGSTVTITGTPTLASYTLMTATSFAGITPVLASPIAGYDLTVDGGNTLKLVQAGYSSWAGINGAGVNREDDHDGDGVQNGVEFFIGGPNGNTTGFTALPGVIDTAGTLSITWPKGAGYSGVYNTDFVVETSATLSGVWTAETIGGGNITDTSGSVKYTFPAGPPYSGKKFARLKVTGP